MKAQPLVSIMIPTFNQAGLLMKAVDSALAQDYPNKEIIVCDDHSSDTTIEVLQRYKDIPGIQVHRNATNLGRVANYRHILYDLSSGDWALNLDGDDYLTDSRFISSAMASIASNANTVFVQAGHIVTSSGGQTIRVDVPKIGEEIKIIAGTDYFLDFHHFSHLATLYDRRLACSLNFYRYDILSSDIESLLRLALHGRVILVKKTVGAWVHHGTNESANLRTDAVEHNMLRIEGPYHYALGLHTIEKNRLRRWRTVMIRKYLFYYLTTYLQDSRRIPGYLREVLRKHSFRVVAVPLAAAVVQKVLKAFKKIPKAS